jgi:hypothetical protein
LRKSKLLQNLFFLLQALIYARAERPSVTEYEPEGEEEELDRVAASRSASISTAAAVASSVIQARLESTKQIILSCILYLLS